jgi:hypothetical protein
MYYYTISQYSFSNEYFIHSGEGFKVLYQVALTILKVNEQMIWNVNDSVDTFQILQNMPRRLIDCHQFMKVSITFDSVVIIVFNMHTFS